MIHRVGLYVTSVMINTMYPYIVLTENCMLISLLLSSVCMMIRKTFIGTPSVSVTNAILSAAAMLVAVVVVIIWLGMVKVGGVGRFITDG